MDIQGSGQFSPYDGQVVEISGIVTLFTARGSSCWLQDPAGDGDSATSDGIFVSGCGFPHVGTAPKVGDFIRIVAQVQEQRFGNALPLTRLRNVELIEVLSSGNPLPAPVPVTDLPDESHSDAIGFWEPLEGMLVSVHDAPVVAATSRFGEFAILTKDEARPGSGFYPQTQQILIRIDGRQLTLVGNHFRSKGGDDPLFGVNWPPNRITEVQRKAQARVVRNFVNTILDEDPNALVMVAGDLNDCERAQSCARRWRSENTIVGSFCGSLMRRR